MVVSKAVPAVSLYVRFKSTASSHTLSPFLKIVFSMADDSFCVCTTVSTNAAYAAAINARRRVCATAAADGRWREPEPTAGVLASAGGGRSGDSSSAGGSSIFLHPKKAST